MFKRSQVSIRRVGLASVHTALFMASSIPSILSVAQLKFCKYESHSTVKPSHAIYFHEFHVYLFTENLKRHKCQGMLRYVCLIKTTIRFRVMSGNGCHSSLKSSVEVLATGNLD